MPCSRYAHKSHVTQKFTKKMRRPQDLDTRFVRARAVEILMDMSQALFLLQYAGKMQRPRR